MLPVAIAGTYRNTKFHSTDSRLASFFRVHTEPGKPEKKAIFMTSQGKLGIVRDFL